MAAAAARVGIAMDHGNIPVSVHGFTWTAAGVWTIIFGGIFASIGRYISQRAPMAKVESDSDASLRKDLMGMIAAQQERHQQEIAAIRAEALVVRADAAEEKRSCATHIERLEMEIRNLRDQLLQIHKSTGAAIEFGQAAAPIGAASAPRVARIRRKQGEGQ
jgi:hypothetical protein